MKRRRWIWAVVSAACVAGGSALAEDVFVKQANVLVRAGKGAVYEQVAIVRKGERLAVIGREGKWLRVRAGGREGYVFETAISDRPVAADSGGLSRLLGAGAGTSAASDTAAGRGVGEALAWAKGNRMDPSGLNRMIAARNGVTPGEWEKFMAEGRVGSARGQQ